MLFLAAAALIGCSDTSGTDEIQKATKKPQASAEALPEIRYYMLSEK